ncbi:MAG: DUF4256 domain-containing protein [Bacteroidales bacterium]
MVPDNKPNKELTHGQYDELLKTLKNRFEEYTNRHKDIDWEKLQARLGACFSGSRSGIEKLWSLAEMERTGGEPDVVGYNEATGEYIFFDCSPESPAGRRNVCYDRKGQELRKANRPASNAVDMAAAMGIELLTEEQYRELQKSGNSASPAGGFDTKTSSWLKTPPAIRKLGGALFADYRYGAVFVYHNSAPSYYGVRGFRGSLRV